MTGPIRSDRSVCVGSECRGHSLQIFHLEPPAQVVCGQSNLRRYRNIHAQTDCKSGAEITDVMLLRGDQLPQLLPE